MIDQIGIAFTGVTAIALSQSSPRLQRYACLFGLAGQPFWFYAAFSAGQWGILVLNCLYTAAWTKGLWLHWIRPAKQPCNPQAAFVYTEGGPSGHKLHIGFASLNDLHKAHDIVIREFSQTKEMTLG